MHDRERSSRRFYDRVAPLYDWNSRFAALLRGASDAGERRKAVERLDLRPGQRVLEVSLGTGINLPYLAEPVGPTGWLVGLDISPGMLRQCRRRLRSRRLAADLIEGEASRLPFSDGAFDAVFHHGGLAEFGDRRSAIAEMARVARAGAKVVICDVGLPSDRRLPLISRLLLRLQPLYAHEPPLDLIPPQARDVQLSWFRGNAWYLIEFRRR